MTDQTKIPAPGSEEVEETGSSLLERVVRNYDLVRLSPPPIPEELRGSAKKRGTRYRRERLEDDGAPAPVAASVEPVQPIAAAPEVPGVVIPQGVETPAVAERSTATALGAPVTFNGPRPPGDRAHPKEQGPNVPQSRVPRAPGGSARSPGEPGLGGRA